MVMELTEEKLRRLVRAVIKEQYDDEFDPEEYFNIMLNLKFHKQVVEQTHSLRQAIISDPVCLSEWK